MIILEMLNSYELLLTFQFFHISSPDPHLPVTVIHLHISLVKMYARILEEAMWTTHAPHYILHVDSSMALANIVGL